MTLIEANDNFQVQLNSILLWWVSFICCSCSNGAKTYLVFLKHILFIHSYYNQWTPGYNISVPVILQTYMVTRTITSALNSISNVSEINLLKINFKVLYKIVNIKMSLCNACRDYNPSLKMNELHQNIFCCILSVCQIVTELTLNPSVFLLISSLAISYKSVLYKLSLVRSTQSVIAANYVWLTAIYFLNF